MHSGTIQYITIYCIVGFGESFVTTKFYTPFAHYTVKISGKPFITIYEIKFLTSYTLYSPVPLNAVVYRVALLTVMFCTALAEILRLQHKPFLLLAAQLQTIHEAIQVVSP